MTEFPDAKSVYYTHDRPENPTLPEDRPRGGGRKDPYAYHRRSGASLVLSAFGALLLVGFLIVFGVWILLGVALFP